MERGRQIGLEKEREHGGKMEHREIVGSKSD